MTHLPYGRQSIDDDDLAAVAEALHAPLLTCGPLVAWFEAALASWPGFQFHGTLSGVRPGTPVPDDLVYSSDRAEPRLDLEATRAMVERVA